MGIYLGDLTVEQFEHRCGIVLKDNERDVLCGAIFKRSHVKKLSLGGDSNNRDT